MLWDLLNSCGRLGLTVVMVWVVTRFRDSLNAFQRLGLGFAAGGSLLTINVIWERTHSPYDGWSVTLLTYGVLSFMLGTAFRYWQHQHRNDEQGRYYMDWLRATGRRPR